MLEFRIGDRVDSDHLLLTMEMEEERYNVEEEREEEGVQKKTKKIICWDKEAV